MTSRYVVECKVDAYLVLEVDAESTQEAIALARNGYGYVVHQEINRSGLSENDVLVVHESDVTR